MKTPSWWLSVRSGLLVLPVLGLGIAGCADPEVGVSQRPFTMYFVPSIDAESIALSADRITDYLEEQLSEKLYGGERRFHIKSAVPTSYVAVVEAFGTGKADFAAFNSFSYILTRDEKGYPVKPVLSVVRGEDEQTYKGQIIVRADSGIERLEDLAGKKFAYTDPASTSGYFLPSKLLRDRGVELGEFVFGQKHDIVVTMVYQGQVDAGATYYSPPRVVMNNGVREEHARDAREKVSMQFPDVVEKVKILEFTRDIPNDPWVIRTNVFEDPEMQKKLEEGLVEALLTFASTADGKDALDELYNITGLVRADDSTYNTLREVVGDVDLDAVINK